VLTVAQDWLGRNQNHFTTHSRRLGTRLQKHVRTFPDLRRANGVATCSQKLGEQAKQPAMAKRHSRVEIATTREEPQNEPPDRTRGEADKIAELEFENSQLPTGD
jgi:hypothetical protein